MRHDPAARRAAAAQLGDPDALLAEAQVAAKVVALAARGTRDACRQARGHLRAAQRDRLDLDHITDLIHQAQQS